MSILGGIIEAAGLVVDAVQESKRKKEGAEALQELRKQLGVSQAALKEKTALAATLEASHKHLSRLLESERKRCEVLNLRVRTLQKQKRALELELMEADLDDSPYETPESGLEAAMLDGTPDTE